MQLVSISFNTGVCGVRGTCDRDGGFLIFLVSLDFGIVVGTCASSSPLEENLHNAVGGSLSKSCNLSVAHFLCVFDRAWVLTISESINFGERGNLSSIICPLCFCRRTLIDIKRGLILSYCGFDRHNGLKFALSLPEQHFVSHSFLNFLHSCSAGSRNAPQVSRMKGR